MLHIKKTENEHKTGIKNKMENKTVDKNNEKLDKIKNENRNRSMKGLQTHFLLNQ